MVTATRDVFDLGVQVHGLWDHGLHTCAIPNLTVGVVTGMECAKAWHTKIVFKIANACHAIYSFFEGNPSILKRKG